MSVRSLRGDPFSVVVAAVLLFVSGAVEASAVVAVAVKSQQLWAADCSL